MFPKLLARLVSSIVSPVVAAFALCLMVPGTAWAAPGTSVLLSQVYGGGGNAGATYKNDFIELFNPTATAVTLTNYSIQYGSATTSTGNLSVFALPTTITLQAGQYYLIQAAAGSAGTVDLVPDASIAAALSGTAGRVALVSSTTAVSACPTADPLLVDFVGFGSATTCSLGTPTATLSNTTAAIRTNVCATTNNNSADFSVSAPVPHNSSTPLFSCAGTVPVATPLRASGVASPAAAYTGSPILLTVTVTPGTLPLSTGIAVTGDLSAAGASATQGFFDDGTHGDLAAGDNIFSYTLNTSTLGALTLPATATDSQLRTAAASIALTVSAPPAFVPIRTIQANKPSTYVTQTVTTSGIVVGVKSNGFFLEAKDADTTPVTPEGILVFTSSTALPSYIQPGAEVQVTGLVSTFPAPGSAAATTTPSTEIVGPLTFTLLTTGNPLPAAIKITAAMDSPTTALAQLTRLEGMRVAIDSLTTTSGTGGTLNETTETNTSNGQFYGVVTGVARPFREPGLSASDLTYGSFPAGVPVWDSNPELIHIDSAASGGGAIDVTSNATLTGVLGVMDFSFGTAQIVLDKTTRPTVAGLISAVPMPVQTATEFTVASFNMERFYNDKVDADNPGSSVVLVTPAAYQRRLAKGSLAIRTVLNSPDIIGVQEVENMPVLTDLAAKISADAITAGQADPVYKPYLFLATDGTAINTGMLVKSTRVTTIAAEQFGLATTFKNAGGSQATLNDRTPLVLHAGIKRGTGLPDYPVTVISVHQRSLINVDDPTSTGATVRLKREAQAEYLATLIQGYQAAGERVVTVGDYNAFEFSDGFVDSLGVITGAPLPATQVITPPVAGLVNPTLVDLVTLLPAAQRQSYVEFGSAQVLDHVVVTRDLAALNTRFVYAHMDSDFPRVYQNDATRPERVSDHDPAVAYFTLPPAPQPVVTLSATAVAFGSQLVGSAPTVRTVTVTNSGTAVLALSSATVTGAGFTQTNNCGTSLAIAGTCAISVVFTPTTTAAATGAVTLVSNAAASPTVIALTGTGGDFTLTSLGSPVSVTRGGTAVFQVMTTSVGSYAGTVTFACTGATAGEVCTLTPASAALAAGGTQLVTAAVTTTALNAQTKIKTKTTSLNSAPDPGRNSGPGGLGMVMGGVSMAALLGCFSQRRLRVYRKALSLGVVLMALGMIAGCSSGSSTVNANATPTGSQTITVTASSGGVTHSTAVTVVVQ